MPAVRSRAPALGLKLPAAELVGVGPHADHELDESPDYGCDATTARLRAPEVARRSRAFFRFRFATERPLGHFCSPPSRAPQRLAPWRHVQRAMRSPVDGGTPLSGHIQVFPWAYSALPLGPWACGTCVSEMTPAHHLNTCGARGHRAPFHIAFFLVPAGASASSGQRCRRRVSKTAAGPCAS